MYSKEDLYEETISTEDIFKGYVFNIKKLKVKLHNGTFASREILEHNGGVCVVAITNENKIVLVEQFRKPIGKIILEVPAGKLEVGEDPYTAIKRELKEETGYTSENIEYLGKITPTPGYSNEYIHIYKATNLKSGNTDFDEGEFINTIELPMEEVVKMIKDGKIEDGKTIASIAYLKL